MRTGQLGGDFLFHIGDYIVYPMHGAGVIEQIEEKEILGEKRRYYMVHMPMGDMRLMVPVETAENIGIRPISSKADLSEALDILAGEQTDMPDNWNRRYRENLDKLKSGEILEVSDVVRNLIIMDEERGLSTGERKLLNSAKQMLITEVALVKNIAQQQAETLVYELVLHKKE